jgi:hypothetical protein
MIGEILVFVHKLDDWLDRRLGKPYHALLGIGLVVEIVRHLREFGDVVSTTGIVKTVLALILFVVLLIHQLGELYEHAGHRKEREA